MAKFFEITDEDIVDQLKTAFELRDLHLVMKMEIIGVEKQKEPIKVTKASDLVRFLSGIDIVIYVNEDVFMRLEEPSKAILVDESMSRIVYDSEKDNIKIEKGDVHTQSLVLEKHGFEQYQSMMINISQVLEQIKEENA